MSDNSYLNNQFLIAMPSLFDPIFHHTVTFLCQHTKEGALGIVINRSADMKLGEIFKQMNISSRSDEMLKRRSMRESCPTRQGIRGPYLWRGVGYDFTCFQQHFVDDISRCH